MTQTQTADDKLNRYRRQVELDLAELADMAAEQATERAQRGDIEGSFYARGLRDAYRAAAAFIDETTLWE